MYPLLTNIQFETQLQETLEIFFYDLPNTTL